MKRPSGGKAQRRHRLPLKDHYATSWSADCSTIKATARTTSRAGRQRLETWHGRGPTAAAQELIQLAAYYQETGTTPADLRDHLHAGRRSTVATIFDRAAERGEIDPEHVTDRMMSLPFDLLRHELLTTNTPASDATLEEIVDTLFLPLVLTPTAAARESATR
ncbi:MULTISPECIES: TetR-like C-terminal domain-containing protein [unclassified Streptomyces]|uniref:TetR-like C-terminal domain-containing protein n=1 Tax=unclassified Streptomyces TaxID=2593676 RepID=UPI0036E86553